MVASHVEAVGIVGSVPVPSSGTARPGPVDEEAVRPTSPAGETTLDTPQEQKRGQRDATGDGTRDPGTNQLQILASFKRFGLRLLLAAGGRWEWVVPFGISILTLVWLTPSGTYLFAQDTLNFINPFTLNNNPLTQFNPIFSWGFPVPDEAPNFYLEGINLAFSHLFTSVGLRERVLAIIGTGAGCVGTWLLLRSVLLVNGLRATQFVLLRSLATLFYVMNPFTLSLIWWHFEGWNLFYIFVPYLLWFLIETTYSAAFRTYPLAVVTVVGIVLGPGLASGFAVSVLLAIVIFAAAIFVKILGERRLSRDRLVRLLAVIGSAPLLLGWSIAPYVLIPHAGLTSSNYVTTANFERVFILQSSTTSLWNVSTLAAISWIYNVPSAYGTPDIGRWLFAPGVLCFVLFLAGTVGLSRWRGLGWLYCIALVSLFAAAGANPPFGPLNTGLLSLRGPFLLLVNAYYFLAEYYVILLTVLILVVPVSLLGGLANSQATSAATSSRARAATPPEGSFPAAATGRGAEDVGTARSADGLPRWARAPVGVAVAGLLLTSVLPFFATPVFQANGDNANSFVVPASFGELRTTLEGDGANSSFFTLVLPMSSSLAVPLHFPSGAGFLDTTDLISSFLPTFVLQANTGELPATLMDFLSTCTPCANLATLLATIHVGWVVWDPFVESSSRLVSLSPSGYPMSLVSIQQSLNTSFVPPQSAGAFRVYTVPNPTPILTVRSGLSVVNVQNATDFYGLLTSINSTPPTSLEDIRGSVWSAANLTSIRGIGVTHAFEYRGIPIELPSNASSDGVVINSTDSVSSLTAWSKFLSPGPPGSVVFAPPSVNALANQSNLSTTMAPSGSSYYSAPDTQTYLSLVPQQRIGSAEDIAMELAPANAHSNWVNTYLQNGSLQVLVQLYAGGASGPYSFGIKANWNGSTFAWQTLVTPDFLTGQPIQVSIIALPGEVTSVLSFGATNVSARLRLGSIAAEATNPGFSRASAPPGNSTLGSQFSVVLQSVYPRMNLSSWSLQAPVPVKFIVIPSGTNDGRIVPSRLGHTSSGDWSVRSDSPVPVGTYFIVLGFAYTSLWGARGGAGGLSTIGVDPDVDVFRVDVVGAPQRLDLAVVFNVHLDEGLYISMLELAAMPFVALLPIVRRR